MRTITEGDILASKDWAMLIEVVSYRLANLVESGCSVGTTGIGDTCKVLKYAGTGT